MSSSRCYDWYCIVENATLEQGDFFFSCPVTVPVSTPKGNTIDVEVLEYDIVVMSQSCDLENGKIDLVLVCPFFPLSDIRKEGYYATKEGYKSLLNGTSVGYHLLNRVDLEDFVLDPVVIDFRNVYSVPYMFLIRHANETPKRVRLLPPYREHLSQAFARFFMRVGLPLAITP
jgi:hypothetical protein